MNVHIRLNCIKNTHSKNSKQLDVMIGNFRCELQCRSSELKNYSSDANSIEIHGHDGHKLIITPDTLQITKNIDSRFPLFFSLHTETLIISNDIYEFKKFFGNLEFCNDYFSYFIHNGEAQTRETPFTNIHKVFNGETLTIRSDGQIKSCCQAALEYLWPTATPREIEPTLRHSVLQSYRQQKPLCLEFSGGLDSTALLLCALREHLPLRTLTLFDSGGSAPDDHRIASALSAKYHVAHRVIDMAGNPKITPDVANHTHHPSIQFLAWDYEQRILTQDSDATATTYLNGHGGDHLFMANPRFETALDLLLAGRIKAFSACLRTLAAFYAIPISLVLRIVTRSWARHAVLRDVSIPYWKTLKEYSIHDWLDREVASSARRVHSHTSFIKNYSSRTPGAQIRATTFYQLAQEISHYRLRDIHAELVFPFFQAEVIRSAFSIADMDTFDEKNSRKAFRSALFEKYQEPNLWRQSKGHTTSMTIGLLLNNQDWIRALFRDGYLVKNGIASWPGLEQEFAKTCKGICGISPSLMHALALEIFIDQNRGRIK